MFPWLLCFCLCIEGSCLTGMLSTRAACSSRGGDPLRGKRRIMLDAYTRCERGGAGSECVLRACSPSWL